MACSFVLLRIREIAVNLCEWIVKFLSEFFSCFLGLETIIIDFLEFEIVDDEASRHNVVLIDIFDERLNTCLSDKLLLVVTAFGSNKVAANSCNEKMGESVALSDKEGTLFPVSMVLTTTAFLPAYLPWVMTTTRPVLKLNEGRSTFYPWLWIN